MLVVQEVDGTISAVESAEMASLKALAEKAGVLWRDVQSRLEAGWTVGEVRQYLLY